MKMKRKIISIKKNSIPTIILYFFVFSLILAISSLDKISVFSKAYDQLAPRTPQEFSLKVGPSSAEIFWKENTEEDIFSYVLHLRTEDEKETSNQILLGKTNNYHLENLSEDTTYFASLSARDKANNESEPTEEIGFTPDHLFPRDFQVAAWMQASADLEEAKKSYENNIEIFSSLSPFWYSAQEDGAIEKRGEIMDEHLYDISGSRSVKIIPTITNNFDQDSKLSNLLRNEENVEKHIDNIMREVNENNYDGIDIDYENLDAEVKSQFTDFIRSLADKLHQQEKIISISVQAKRSDGNVWSGAGACDFSKLGEIVDQFRVMTYDFSRTNTSPGPISPIYWFEEVLEYTKSNVPKEKILAGIPFYGYQWCTAGDGESCQNKGLTWEGVSNIISQYDPVLERNDNSKTPWFLYIDDENNTKVVNYEDHQSVEDKLKVVKDLDIGGIAVWRLGSEDPQNFEAIRNTLGKKVKPPQNVHITPMDHALKVTWEKSDEPSIKGYRITIKSKLDLANIGDNFDFEDVASEDGGSDSGATSSGEALDSYSASPWKKDVIDVYDEGEYVVNNLENGKPYYISVMSLIWEIDPEETILSEEEKQNRSSGPVIATPTDFYYPGKIIDLNVGGVDATTVDLSWTTPGDNYFEGLASQFDIRYYEKEITADNFSEAYTYESLPTPVEPKSLQSWQIRGLEPGIKYYFAVKTKDESGNSSDISNVVSAETIDNIPPSVPDSPELIAFDEEIFVRWKGSEEKDVAGYKIFYKQENSFYNIIDVDSEATHFSIKNLENNYNYYISLSAYDTHGNESARSGDAKAMPKSQASVNRLKSIFDKSSEKIKAALAVFSKRLFNEKAIPFIVVISVLVINFFIYQGLKREINRKNKKRKIDVSPKRSDKIIDLKNIRRTLK